MVETQQHDIEINPFASSVPEAVALTPYTDAVVIEVS